MANIDPIKKSIELDDACQNSLESQKSEETVHSPNEVPDNVYIKGWRLHCLTVALFLSLMIAHMEATIVSTSIIEITNELGGFSESAWVFTGFLLTYSGFVIIYAKLSDIYGRKPLLLASLFIFTLFSGACGASQTLTQLIIFRCFQGVGAAGIFSLVIVVVIEMVPPVKYPLYTAILGVAVAVAVTFGPLIGGAINDNTTWRWVFLLNVPVGVLCFLMLAILQPTIFPNQSYLPPELRNSNPTYSIKSLNRIDVLGASFLLGAGIVLIVGLQWAVDTATFNSSVVLGLLITSGVMWVGFVLWSWFVTTKRQLPEPIFPWRFVTDRVCMGMLLNTLFNGAVLVVCTIQIPQRFQTVNNESAFTAGTRLLPFSIGAPFGAIVACAIIEKTVIPPIYFLFAGGIFEIAGTVGLALTPVTSSIWSPQYGFQILAGTGVGLFTGVLQLIVPFAVEKRDIGVGTAAMAQFKILGGMVVLAIVTSIMNQSIRSDLLEILPADNVGKLLETTKLIITLPTAAQVSAREVFGRGYNLQMKIIIGVAVAQIPSTFLMWTKKPLMVEKNKT